MATAISRTYRNVTWANETKNKINCEIVVNLDDGSSQVFEASVAQVEGGNPDWDAIMDQFGVEAIDTATTDAIVKRNADRERRILLDEENRKKEDEFRKQEALFAIKLEAFEIEAVKNSKNRELKAMIRKSKTLMEVQAYTTMLLMKELDNAEPVVEAEQPQPSAE